MKTHPETITKAELKKYLAENLSVEIDESSSYVYETKVITVRLLLEGECISSSSEVLHND